MSIRFGCKLSFFCYLLVCFFLSCKTVSDDLPESGLTTWKMEVEYEDLGMLNNSVTAKYSVFANLKISSSSYRIKINYAGRSTLDAPKKSYDVHFDKPYRGRRVWRLSAQYKDPTMIKAKLGFDIFEAAGLWAPQVEFVSLHVNREVKGLYQLQSLVDKEFFRARDYNVRYLFKAKFGNAGFGKDFLPKLGEAYSERFDKDDWTQITRLWVVLNQEEVDLKEVAALINVDLYLRYVAACVVLNHWDGYRNNYYLGTRQKAEPFVIVPWDLDRIYEDGYEYQAGVSPFGDNQLTQALLVDPTYKKAYLTILRELLASPPVAQINERAREFAELIEKAYAQDYILSRRFDFQIEQDRLNRHITNWLTKLKAELATLSDS